VIRFRTRPRDNVIITKCRLFDCDLIAKVPLRSVNCTCADITECRFIGQFEEIDFGNWPVGNISRAEGSLVNCDFAGSKLDSCRFFACNMRQMVLPVWPCFTVLHPRQTYRQIAARIAVWENAPDWLKQWIAAEARLVLAPAAENAYRDLAAMSNYWPRYSKWMLRGMNVPEVPFRDFLRQCEDVIL
jgi:hypothetical protein